MTGNLSQPWHPDRKHYRCSRRENLTESLSIFKINLLNHNLKAIIVFLIFTTYVMNSKCAKYTQLQNLKLKMLLILLSSFHLLSRS